MHRQLQGMSDEELNKQIDPLALRIFMRLTRTCQKQNKKMNFRCLLSQSAGCLFAAGELRLGVDHSWRRSLFLFRSLQRRKKVASHANQVSLRAVIAVALSRCHSGGLATALQARRVHLA